jgi:hypothetical protein
MSRVVGFVYEIFVAILDPFSPDGSDGDREICEKFRLQNIDIRRYDLSTFSHKHNNLPPRMRAQTFVRFSDNPIRYYSLVNNQFFEALLDENICYRSYFSLLSKLFYIIPVERSFFSSHITESINLKAIEMDCGFSVEAQGYIDIDFIARYTKKSIMDGIGPNNFFNALHASRTVPVFIRVTNIGAYAFVLKPFLFLPYYTFIN